MNTNNDNRICQLFGIEWPIIAGGMAWCSGWRLAAAVSNAGGLGLIGAGSMHPETLLEHINKLREAVGDRPWGVNLPLVYPEADRVVDLMIENRVPIVFTSAGNPKRFTQRLRQSGAKVAHVVASSRFVAKCEEAGVDAIVAEGFEAGGHNGREETTTMALIPAIRRRSASIPLIAAGGIASGQAILAAQALGADGVQIGTLFALSQESSASQDFKERCASLGEGDTMLCLKRLVPTRMVRNKLYNRVAEAEGRGADAEELRQIMAGAAKRGIFEGDTDMGALEIGQVAAEIRTIQSVAEIMARLKSEYAEAASLLGHNLLGDQET